MIEEDNWKIEWGEKSAFNLGRVKNNPFASDYRIERYKDDENKWRYFISNSREYCAYYDGKQYNTTAEIDEAVIAYMRRKW